MPEREIYLLSPRALSPETIAVAFAKTSRAPESFREIAAELSDETSAKFHEKWVVGYGHASVAEHAVLHFAFENVSRIAIETIEAVALVPTLKNPPAIKNGDLMTSRFRLSWTDILYAMNSSKLFASFSRPILSRWTL
jgi:hypothetical protein